MRTRILLVLALCGACGGATDTAGSANGSGPSSDTGQRQTNAVWWETCGMPACGIDRPPPESGLPYCSPDLVGSACATIGAECNPRTGCDVHLLCGTSDPRQQSSLGCPVSRARFKEDIHFLSGDELRGRSRELLDLPLAAYRYREGDQRMRLGFIIDGHESLACVDGDRVDLYGYTSMAVAALKVQAEEIAALRKQVAEVQKELARRRR
jgi:hypothetical protein